MNGIQLTYPNSYKSNDRGVSVLTFAFTAPIFLLIMVFTFELSIAFIIQNALDAAVREAGRFGIVESPTTGGNRLLAIQNKVQEVAHEMSGGLISNPDPKLIISIKSYASLSNIIEQEPFVDANANGTRDPTESFTDLNGNGVWDTGNGSTGAGGQGDTVVYELSYPFKSFVPVLDTFLANITLSSRTIVVNDLFSGS